VRSYPELLKSRRFWGYTSSAAFSAGAFFAFLGGGPFVATNVFNLSPSQFGFYFMFISAGYAIGNYLSGRIAARIGVNTMMISGNIVIGGGLLAGIAGLLLGISHPSVVFFPMLFVGIGNGLTLPSASAGIVSVRPNLAGTASGLGATMQIGGGAAFSAVSGALVAAYSSAILLLVLMMTSIALSLLASLYVVHVDRSLANNHII